MTELLLCLLLLAVGGLVWSLRDNANPAALWAWGWVVVAGMGISVRFGAGTPWAPTIAQLLSPLLPGFLLAGALAYADRVVPRWLLPGALGVGALRWLLTLSSVPQAGHWIGIVPEPAVELLAAFLVFQVGRAPGAAIAQRLLAPAFVSVAAVDAITALYVFRGAALPYAAMLAWPVISVVTLGLQITAAGHRAREHRRTLQREGEQARQALRESEERFAVLAEHTSDLIWELDSSTRVTYVSPSVSRMLGHEPDELLGSSAFDWVHPDDRELAVRELARALEAQESVDLVLRTLHRDGSWRRLEARVRGFRNASGELRVVGISRDVTEHYEQQQSLRRAHDTLEQRVESRTAQLRKAIAELEREVAARRLAERELRASRERYRTVSELSSDFSYGFRVARDGSLELEWVTDAFGRITGYSFEEIMQKGWEAMLGEEHWQTARSKLAAALEGETAEFEGTVTTRSGETRWLHSRLAAARSEADGKLRVVGASRDVTERRRAEEERRRLEHHLGEVQRLESLGALAGGIAHDFNNLLGVILGNCSLGAADAGPDSESGRRFARIRSAAQHAAGLTEQMLTYSGKAPASLRPIDLSRVVADTADLLEASIPAHSRLELALEGDLPAIDGDETQLRQVVVNLVTNAAEALGEDGGRVAVRTGTLEAGPDEPIRVVGAPPPPPGQYVFLEVEDSGQGMDEGRQERIFEPFFTTHRAGRGLGLAAVLGIVQGHRGAVTLESEVDRGTIFRVLFPPSGSSRRIEPPRPRPEPAPRGRGRVLVIDDDEDVLEIGRETLKRSGFEVRTARGGREGVALLRRCAEEIDAVVLDLMMPDLGGEDTLREIHRIRGDLPVVLVSGFHEDRTVERFAPEELAGFLRKPYEPEDLILAVQAALER